MFFEIPPFLGSLPDANVRLIPRTVEMFQLLCQINDKNIKTKQESKPEQSIQIHTSPTPTKEEEQLGARFLTLVGGAGLQPCVYERVNRSATAATVCTSEEAGRGCSALCMSICLFVVARVWSSGAMRAHGRRGGGWSCAAQRGRYGY